MKIIINMEIQELRFNEKLLKSLWPDISDSILNELQDTKLWIEKQKEDWRVVAVVHLSWDLTHAAHIWYMNTIRKKLREEIWKPFKLLVWVEADSRTLERKWKKNIFSEQERKYIFENIKAVDKAYIEFESIDEQTNDKRPAWIIEFLSPDVMVTHEEHLPSEDYDQVSNRVSQSFWWKLVVVNYLDEEKYFWESQRDKYNLSTTRIIKDILKNFKFPP